MEARATLRYARISPRKVQIVLDLIRNKDADKAMAILRFTPNNHGMDISRCYVAECHVGPGPILKRIRAKDHGRAHRILKRTSHVTLVLRERED